MNNTSNDLLRHTAAAILLSSIGSLTAQTVSFGSNETIELASGWVAIAQPSGFTPAEQASIMQRVNAKLQAAGHDQPVQLPPLLQVLLPPLLALHLRADRQHLVRPQLLGVVH